VLLYILYGRRQQEHYIVALYAIYIYMYGHTYIYNAQNRPLSNEAATAYKADHLPAVECTSGRSIIIIIIIILSYRRARLNQRVIITQNIGALPDRTTRHHRPSWL